MAIIKDQLIEHIENKLPDSLKTHIYRSCEVGRKLCGIHSVDTEKVEIALLGHDLYRAYSDNEMLNVAEEKEIEISYVEKASPLLLHGVLASITMQEQYKVSDKQIIESIKYHTSGMEEMDEVFMTVFLADKLDPKKIEKNSQLEPINQTAQYSLSDATLMYLNMKISSIIDSGHLVHPDSLDARNSLLLKTRI
ncbi:MAG: hypothetical protein CMM30_06540 [Rhodospirillaceae bacterium]|jgi:predicted HD superfamily hydrolase involved in NAD metabolism|nr:hypothetical protein [Rhodospirillaceae bacterium]MCH2522151.1 bis(5'-nucleosyl)-tetraphosphatase (symmetrical) YqeK [Dehalococcoidia bacterium]|tara:strand:- start:789 stop:1370 length:582 start_codon:yes stop_codon:yes gene_type:complete